MNKKTIYIALFSFIGIGVNAQNLTLDSCKSIALENNKKLIEAKLEYKASEQVKKNAFTHYFPKVDATGMAIKADRNLINVQTPEMNFPVYDGNPMNLLMPTQFTYVPGMSYSDLDNMKSGVVTAIQPLYAGGRIRNGNKLANLGKDVNEYNISLTKEEVLTKTELYYWNIIALEKKQQTLKSYEKMLNNLYKDVQVAYDAGLVNKSDLLKVQLEINKINANKLKLDNGITLLKMTLAQHIGIEHSEDFELNDEEIQIANPGEMFINPDNALVNRQEYKMLNKTVEAEVLQKRLSFGENMPQLAVGIAGTYMNALEMDDRRAFGFATLSIPISGWWGGSHNIKEHQIKVDIAQNNLDEKSELLKLQMEKAFKDLNESYEQIKVAESSKHQAEEHLKVVKDNYDAGIVNTSDLLEAQAILQQAHDELVDAKAMYKIKQAYYLQAIASQAK